jgi:SSS family solute:Na+ symporter
MLIRPSFPPIMQSPINSGAIAMLAGLVIVPIVSAFTKKPDKQLVDDAFACYEKPTSVAQKTALGSK